MSSFQSAVGLPPLSVLAAVTHESDAASGPGIGGNSNIHPSGVSNASSAGVDYRDTRPRDPVPKKLKGRGADMNGFGVIQMDLVHEQALERDEVAKRASESSEQAAIRAYQSGYNTSSAVKRFVRVPDDDAGAWDSYGSSAAQNTSQHTGAQSTTQSASPPIALRTLPLNFSEAKEEQARLLALLRSSSPLSVVDQICKALAFFGGVPDAALHADGTFPRSEMANGSGSVFIGWLAEIFPESSSETTFSKMARQPSHVSGLPSLTGDGSAEGANASGLAAGQGQRSEALGNTNSGSGAPEAGSGEKRRRGRPKGSKATKVRRDKGIKKGPLKARKAVAEGDPSAAKELQPGLRVLNNDGTTDDSWVDVDEDNMLDVGGAVGGSFLFPTNAETGHTANNAPGTQGARQPPTSGAGDSMGGTAGVEPAQNLTENGKKRGRPKGSKNRPKPADADVSGTKDGGASGLSNVTPIPPPAVPTAGAPKKSNIGRPKGSTSKRTEAPAPSASQDSGYDASGTATGPHHPTSASDAVSIAPGNKRKRSKAAKQDGIPSDQGQASVGGAHSGASADLLHTSVAPTSKKQRKIGDARASVQTSVGSVSPATDTMVHNSNSGLGSAGPSLGSDDQMMPSLDTSSGGASDFAFDTLSSHLGQSTPTSLASQHQHDHEQAMSSLRQQLPQHRQQAQQQPLAVQKTMSSTPPFHGADGLQGLPGGGRHQQQHLGQGPGPHQANSLPQVAGLAVSSAASQHSAQTQMTASLSSGSLANQQLPRPSRTPQPFYAPNRSGSNGQFGQPLPQPQQQQQQQQQQDQQSHQKQQFASQYQPQGPYSSQQPQQQAFAPQPRHPSQSMGSSSPGLLTPSTAHRSPQFNGPSATGLRNVAGAYGTSQSTGAMGFGTSTYDQARRQNPAGSPSLGSAYGPPGTGSHSLGHHASPSFGTSRPQHSPNASHAQNVGGAAPGIQGFHGFDGSNIFDNMSLDPNANGNSGLGLGGPAAYNLGGGVSRTSSNTGGFGPAPSINSFDASMSAANMRDRFYSMRR